LSTADEIMQALQQAGAGVGQGVAAATAAKGKAEQAIAQSSALGAQDKIAQFTAVKNAIEELIAGLNGSREKAAGVVARARAAAG
jgi:hypothetical protein